MAFFSRFASVVAILLAIVTLAACSASSRVVRTYEGEALDASRVARLLKPQDIEILSVDGKETKSFLMDNLAMTYELVPGQHTVVFRYSTLWSIPGKKQTGEANAEEIRSERVQVTFNAVAGRTYTFEVPEPGSRAEAVRAAQTFSTRLIDENKRSIAVSTAYVAPSRLGETAAASGAPVAPVVVDGGAVAPNAAANVPVVPAATPGGNLSNLDALKVLWQNASTEDKKEFLRWAFQ